MLLAVAAAALLGWLPVAAQSLADCPGHCINGSCFETGSCVHGCEEDYYQPPRCSECKFGFWDDYCNATCPENCLKDKCSRLAGYCELGCDPGYFGTVCDLQDTEDNQCYKFRNCTYGCPPVVFGLVCSDACSLVCDLVALMVLGAVMAGSVAGAIWFLKTYVLPKRDERATKQYTCLTYPIYLLRRCLFPDRYRADSLDYTDYTDSENYEELQLEAIDPKQTNKKDNKQQLNNKRPKKLPGESRDSVGGQKSGTDKTKRQKRGMEKTDKQKGKTDKTDSVYTISETEG